LRTVLIETMHFTKREILKLLEQNKEQGLDAVRDYIFLKLNVNIADVSDDALKRLQVALASLKAKNNIKFNAAFRMRNRYESKNSDWLDSKFQIPNLQSSDHSKKNDTTNMGRPTLAFDKKSNRSKRREAAEISTQHDHNTEKIIMAGCHAARHSSDNDLHYILTNLSSTKQSKKCEIY